MSEDSLFKAAVEITNPERRAAFVEAACDGDAALRDVGRGGFGVVFKARDTKLQRRRSRSFRDTFTCHKNTLTLLRAFFPERGEDEHRG